MCSWLLQQIFWSQTFLRYSALSCQQVVQHMDIVLTACFCGSGGRGRNQADAGKGGKDRAGPAADHGLSYPGSQQPSLPAPVAQCSPVQQPCHRGRWVHNAFTRCRLFSNFLQENLCPRWKLLRSSDTLFVFETLSFTFSMFETLSFSPRPLPDLLISPSRHLLLSAQHPILRACACMAGRKKRRAVRPGDKADTSKAIITYQPQEEDFSTSFLNLLQREGHHSLERSANPLLPANGVPPGMVFCQFRMLYLLA